MSACFASLFAFLPRPRVLYTRFFVLLSSCACLCPVPFCLCRMAYARCHSVSAWLPVCLRVPLSASPCPLSRHACAPYTHMLAFPSILHAAAMSIGIARTQKDYADLAPRLARASARMRQPGFLRPCVLLPLPLNMSLTSPRILVPLNSTPSGGPLHRDKLARSILFDEAIFAQAMLRCLRILAEVRPGIALRQRVCVCARACVCWRACLCVCVCCFVCVCQCSLCGCPRLRLPAVAVSDMRSFAHMHICLPAYLISLCIPVHTHPT